MIYKYIIMGAGSLLAVAGASFFAYNHGLSNGRNEIRVEWQEDTKAKEKAIESAVTIIRELQEDNTKKVVVEYVDRVNTITNTRTLNRDVIQEVFLETPYVPRGWVYAHDQLVDGAIVDPAQAADLTPSEFTYGQVLEVVATNYGIANQGIAKDEAWNSFYTGVLRSYDDYRLPASSGSGSGDSSSTSRSTPTVNATITEAGED